MRLPVASLQQVAWPTTTELSAWQQLSEKARIMAGAVTGGDAFDDMVVRIRSLVGSGKSAELQLLLRHRLGARALTWLWLNDRNIARQTFSVRWLDLLIESQQPRLTRLTLIHLIQLYFKHFDNLKEYDSREPLQSRLQSRILESVNLTV